MRMAPTLPCVCLLANNPFKKCNKEWYNASHLNVDHGLEQKKNEVILANFVPAP
jgi:hypothetical protein